MQLLHAVQPNRLRPRWPWISYKDPNKHLASVADRLGRLPGIHRLRKVGALGPASAPFLQKLRERGWAHCRQLDPAADMGIAFQAVGTESIQANLTLATARRIAARRGKCDVLIALHILEHACRPARFLAALRELMAPGGYLIVEVPDSLRAMRRLDYSCLWEEHILYFTPHTLEQTLHLAGFSIAWFKSYYYRLEDSLVAIARLMPGLPCRSLVQACREPKHTAAAFAGSRRLQSRRLQRYLNYRRQEGPIALMGAGHRSCMFVNLLELGRLLDFVVDTDPNKQGLRMPGSRLQILHPAALLDRGSRFCLLGVSPDNEAKVRFRNQAFLRRGGTFESIYPDSRIALPVF